MKRRLVYVEWEDSHAIHGWCNPSEVLKDPILCVSVGWLLEEVKDRIVLGSSLSFINGIDDPRAASPMAIPKVCIKRLSNMKLPYKSKLPPGLKYMEEE